jgi:tetratricopeptide (TPR) repeat protein
MSTKKPTVLISYSHKDEAWKDRLVPQLRALEQAGRIVVWDDRKIDAGQKWYPEIKNALEEAAVAVCLISPDYLASGFCMNEEIPFLLQRRERDGMVFIPLLLRPCPWRAFDWLKEIQMLPRDGQNVVVDFRGIEDAVFADVANLILRIVDNPAEHKLPAPPEPIWSSPEKVDIERLPVTGAELFGRQRELELLDKAWDSDNTNIVSFVAWGGVGKSTLVNKWLERMEADNYRGARRVYAWSFYSQGTGERVTSADQFINAALIWFGDPDPTAGSPWDKGHRIASLIQKEKTLLLLDGLEPLQSGRTFERGRIKEPALVTVLTELAKENQGLCVISTREKVVDLEEFSGSVIEKDLEQISDEAGRALLRVGGVLGTNAELQVTTRDFGNHALAINLLAVYLHDIPGHLVSNALDIPDIETPEEKGKHPRRVMAAFAHRYGDGPERELLRLLGLFDRPADNSSVAALRVSPPIPGLTNHLHSLSEADWLRLIETLRRTKLMTPARYHGLGELDAHPLVREHFAQELKRQHPAAWREGNNCLYEHLRRTAKEFPDTLEEMNFLYAAVAHGCKAGRYHEALDKVYWNRIQRRNEYFNWRKLGAYGADLAVLTDFFDQPWIEPVSALTDHWKAFVLNDAGIDLLGLGRLVEATKSVQSSLDMYLSQKDWRRAARVASNLGELYLTYGALPEVLARAPKDIEIADRGGEIVCRIIARSTLAIAHDYAGHAFESDVAMREAEALESESQSDSPLHSVLAPFRFCIILLHRGKYEEVQNRAMRILERAKQAKMGLLYVATSHLLLGSAHFLQARSDANGDYLPATRYLNEAVVSLRQAAAQNYLPRGLMARAELYRVKDQLDQAHVDLDEAMNISRRGSMGLFEVDCHLEYARLYLAMSYKKNVSAIKQVKRKRAEEHWTTAKEMIDRMGYHRRDKDVQEIEVQLAQAS